MPSKSGRALKKMVDKRKFVRVIKTISTKGTPQKQLPKPAPAKAVPKISSKPARISLQKQPQKQPVTTQPKPQKQFITKDTSLGDIAYTHPEAAAIMMKYGLHCIGCHVAAFETIEQGCKGHGMSDEQIKNMLHEINEAVKKEKK